MGDDLDAIRERLSRGFLDEARLSYDRHVLQCEHPVDFYLTMKILPALWESNERARRMEWLYERFSTRQIGTVGSHDRVNTIFVQMCLSIGTRRYDRFMELCPMLGGDLRTHPMRPFIQAAASSIGSPRFPDLDARKIFCIGLSRTGTSSLNQAISDLGIASSHFFNPFTGFPLEMDDFDLFEAFSDTPVCVCFERLSRRYPNSVFIYTTRDLTSWKDSLRHHFLRTKGVCELGALRSRMNSRSPDFSPQCGPFDHELYLNYESLEAAYTDYDARVRGFFADKEHRLLTIDIRRDDAWGRVCDFLNVGAPATPFPHLNKALGPV